MSLLNRKIKSFLTTILIYNVVRNWNWLFLLFKSLRPKILRFCGAKIGRNVYISPGCYFDNNLNYLTIGDDVLISPNVMFLFHKRDLKDMKRNDLYNTKPHIKKEIVVKNNSFIGMGSIIMPGVTIGEGAGVAAGSLVTKNVEDWTIVAGVPAKPIKNY